MLSTKHHTPALKKTVNPVYTPKDATFEFPLYLSLADKLGVIELVIWDKDMLLKKDYLGEVSIPLDDWFKDDNAYSFDDPNNKVRVLFIRIHGGIFSAAIAIFAQRSVDTHIYSVHRHDTGQAWVRAADQRAGLQRVLRGVFRVPQAREAQPRVGPAGTNKKPLLNEVVYIEADASWQTEGIGTIRSHQSGPEFQDDGLSSDDGESDSGLDEDDVYENATDMFQTVTPPLPTASPETMKVVDLSPSLVESQTTPTPLSAMRTPTLAVAAPQPQKMRSPSFTKKFLRRPSSKRSSSVDSSMFTPTMSASSSTPNLSTPGTSAPPSGTVTPTTGSGDSRRPTMNKARFRKSWGAKNTTDYNFSASQNDIMGIVLLEIKGAKDLPRLRNSTCHFVS